MKHIWTVTEDHRALHWDCECKPEDHTDFIEMSGLYASAIITYGIRGGRLTLQRHPVFPMLRTFPNNTHSSWQFDIPEERIPVVSADGKPVAEYPCGIILNGTLEIISRDDEAGLLVARTLFVSPDQTALCELVEYENMSGRPLTITAEGMETVQLARERGPHGLLISERTVRWDGPADGILEPDATAVMQIVYAGRIAHQPTPEVNVQKALADRRARVNALTAPLTLSTGNDILDTMFHFAKIRAGESIYRTRCGDVHSPGGGSLKKAQL